MNEIERFIKEIKRRTKVIELFPRKMSIDKVLSLVVGEMNERYAGRRLKNYEALKEELEGLRKARYGSEEIRIFLNEEVLQHGYTQNS